MEATGLGTLIATRFPGPTVAAERCSGCGRCVAACPAKMMNLEVSGFRKHAAIREPSRCASCTICADACLLGAITSLPKPQTDDKIELAKQRNI